MISNINKQIQDYMILRFVNGLCFEHQIAAHHRRDYHNQRETTPPITCYYATKGSEIEYARLCTHFTHLKNLYRNRLHRYIWGLYIFSLCTFVVYKEGIVRKRPYFIVRLNFNQSTNMPQGKLKVKTKLPAKSKPKKKTGKGPAATKRTSEYNIFSKLTYVS